MINRQTRAIVGAYDPNRTDDLRFTMHRRSTIINIPANDRDFPLRNQRESSNFPSFPKLIGEKLGKNPGPNSFNFKWNLEGEDRPLESNLAIKKSTYKSRGIQWLELGQ